LFISVFGFNACNKIFVSTKLVPIPISALANAEGNITLNSETSPSINTIWPYQLPFTSKEISQEKIKFRNAIPFTIETQDQPFYRVINSTCNIPSVNCEILYGFRTVATPGIYIVSLGTMIQSGARIKLDQNIVFQVLTPETISSQSTYYGIEIHSTPELYANNYIKSNRTVMVSLKNETSETVRLETSPGTADQFVHFDTSNCQITTWAMNQVCTFSITLGVQNSTMDYSRIVKLIVYNKYGQHVIHNIPFNVQGITEPNIVVSVSSLSLVSPGIDRQTTITRGIAYQGVITYTNTNSSIWGSAMHFNAYIPVSGIYSVSANNCNNITLASNQSCTVGISVWNTNLPGIYAQSLGNFIYQNLEQAQLNTGFTTKYTALTAFTSFDPLSSQDIAITQSSNVSFQASAPTLLPFGITTTMTLIFTNTDTSGTMRHFTYQTSYSSGVTAVNSCQNINLLPGASCTVTLAITISVGSPLIVQPVGEVFFNNVAGTLITKSYAENIYVYAPTQPTIVMSSSFSQNPNVPSYFPIDPSGVATIGTLTYTNISPSPYEVAQNFQVDLDSTGIFTVQNHCSGINLAPGKSCTVGISVANVTTFGLYVISFGTTTYFNGIQNFVQTNGTSNEIYFLGDLTLDAYSSSSLSTNQALPTTFYTTLFTGIITTAEVRFVNTSLDPRQIITNIAFIPSISTQFSIVSNSCSGSILHSNTYCRIVYALHGAHNAGVYGQSFGAIQGNSVLTRVSYVSNRTFYTKFMDIPVLSASMLSTMSTDISAPTAFYVTHAGQVISHIVLTYTNQSLGQIPMTGFTAHITAATGFTIVSNHCQNAVLNTIAMPSTNPQFCTIAINVMANQYGNIAQNMGTVSYNMSGDSHFFTNTDTVYGVITTPPEVMISVTTMLSQDFMHPTNIPIATNTTTTKIENIVFTNISDDTKEIATNFTFVTQATTQYTIVSNSCMQITLATGQSCTVSLQFIIPMLPANWIVPLGFASFQDITGVQFNTANSTGYLSFSGDLTFTVSTYTHLAMTIPGTPFMTQSPLSVATSVTVVYTNTSSIQANNVALVNSLYAHPWHIVGNTCMGNILPGNSCTVSIALHRLSIATETTILLPGLAVYNSSGSMHILTNTTMLYARFIEPFLSVNIISTLSTSLSDITIFATQAAMVTENTSIIEFTNHSTEFTITDINVLTTLANQFVIESNCTGSLAPGSSCAAVLSVISTDAFTTTVSQRVPHLEYTDIEQHTEQLQDNQVFYIAFGQFFTKIRARQDFACGITRNQLVYCWGLNFWGKLGIGPGFWSVPFATPQRVISISSIIDIAVGVNHACAIDTAHHLYCWGSNDKGELGLGFDSMGEETPRLVTAVTYASVASLGAGFTCIINANHELYCWGNNYYGQLGMGFTNYFELVPHIVTAVSSVSYISAGDIHMCAIDASHQLYCWGANYWGGVGNGSQSQQSEPEPQLLGLANVSSVSAGDGDTCALSNKQLYCWGDNSFYGQLGLGDMVNRYVPTPLPSMNNITAVIVGAVHTCAVSDGTELYCWGDNGYGELGLGVGGNDPMGNTPPEVTPQFIYSMTDFTEISLGNLATYAIHGYSSYGWGANTYGQLGVGDYSDRNLPTVITPIL
jgi:alpha-tubulin suppressor-like RCC1 family protein